MNLLEQLTKVYKNLASLGHAKLAMLAGAAILSVGLVLAAGIMVNKPAYDGTTSEHTGLPAWAGQAASAMPQPCHMRRTVCGAYQPCKEFGACPCPTGSEQAPGQRRGAPQLLVRLRTMKLSKVSSVTCHHRYWSARKAAIDS